MRGLVGSPSPKGWGSSQGVSYSQKSKEGYGGLSKSEFFVDAPKNAIHVSSGKYGDIQVSVKSIERDALIFKPLIEKKREYIIVGIDPGTTIAYAVFTLDEKLRGLYSSRTASIPEVIEKIAQEGRPLIIASDVYPTPNSVEKIRRAFNALAFSPDDVLTSEMKIEIAKPFEYSNNHERDAIAAAVSFFRKNKNKFTQIKKRLPSGIELYEAMAQVIKGSSLDNVIRDLTKTEPIKKEVEVVKTKTEVEKQVSSEVIKKYEEDISELKKYIDELKSELSVKDDTLRKLETLINKQKTEIYKELKKEKAIKIKELDISRLKGQITNKNKQISHLEERIHKLKTIRRLEISGRVIPIKIISAFTKDSILLTRQQFGIKKDDIILLKDASGGGSATAKLLHEFGVRVIIICNEMSHAAEEELFELNIPVILSKDVKIHFGADDEFAAVNPEDIDKAIEEWNKKAEIKRKIAKEKWLESIVDEYRSERRKAI